MSIETAEKRKYRRLTPENIQRAQTLLSQGMTAKVVADNLGVGVATIYKLKNGHSNGNGTKTSRVTKINGEDTLISRIKDAVEELKTGIQFHTAKAQESQAQLDELKGTFSDLG